MVVGQDLGITLDMETFNVRAHAKGIRQATDLVVMGAAADDADPGSSSGGVVLTLLHHPTGESAQRHCDWVVCAVHQAPEDALWLSLIHISEPTRLGMISYAVFCLKKKK